MAPSKCGSGSQLASDAEENAKARAYKLPHPLNTVLRLSGSSDSLAVPAVRDIGMEVKQPRTVASGSVQRGSLSLQGVQVCTRQTSAEVGVQTQAKPDARRQGRSIPRSLYRFVPAFALPAFSLAVKRSSAAWFCARNCFSAL